MLLTSGLHTGHTVVRAIVLSKAQTQTSLVAQWLRVLLTMPGTPVRFLVREDPTCRGATKPVCHNY